MIETVSAHEYRFVGTVRRGTPAAVSSDVWRAYLLGRHEWSHRSQAALRHAIDHFLIAIELDPYLAVAHSGLADCYAALGSLSHLTPDEAFAAARQHADKALALDPRLAEAHASLGFVRLYYDWDWPGADVAFRRAIELDPDHAPSHQWYSTYLLAAGRLDEAMREIALAHRREPLSLAVNTDLGFQLYYGGRHDEALKQLAFTLTLNANFAPAHLWLGRTYQELGRFEEALRAFRQVAQQTGDWPVAIAARGFVEARAGRHDEARHTLATLERLRSTQFVTAYGMALIHAGLGQVDDTFMWLHKAIEERSNWLVWLRLDPRWDGLRPDPRFAACLSRLGFPLVNRLPAKPEHCGASGAARRPWRGHRRSADKRR